MNLGNKHNIESLKEMNNIALLITVILLAIFICCIVKHMVWIKWRSPAVTIPPSPPKLPILGHIHLLTDMPHHSLAQLAQKYGPIVYLKLGQVPTVVISSAYFAREVLKTHDHIFCNRPQLTSAQHLSFGCSDVTFSSYGPYWRQARKICVTELLSSRRINSFRLVRDEETNRLLTILSTKSGSELDMSKLFFSLANDVLCRVAFGKRFISESIESSHEREGKNWSEIFIETQDLFAGFCMGDFFPGWGWVNSVSGFKRRLEKNLEDLRVVCDKIIEEHLNKRNKENGGENGSNIWKEDFVDVLLRIQKQDDLEVPISDNNLKALVLDMLVAGTDTTASALEFAMSELARHPSIMKKAQDEVRGIKPKGGKLNEDHLQSFRFLKAIIKEALRLHPPVPLLVPRESMAPCTINSYYIPARTRVLINAFAIGRDPKSWQDPLQFKPERFMEEFGEHDQGKDQAFKFLPFGGGRRGCPGFSFGLATVEITLARLLYHFDWSLPQGITADQLDLTEIFGLDVRKKIPLVLVPTLNEGHPLVGN